MIVDGFYNTFISHSIHNIKTDHRNIVVQLNRGLLRVPCITVMT